MGMRFNDLNIPQGVTITNALIQFKVDETNSGTTTLMIEGQATDNAPTFPEPTLTSRLGSEPMQSLIGRRCRGRWLVKLDLISKPLISTQLSRKSSIDRNGQAATRWQSSSVALVGAAQNRLMAMLLELLCCMWNISNRVESGAMLQLV